MKRRPHLAAAWILAVLPAFSAHAQVNYQPTPTPAINADREAWYLAGEPVMHDGNIYYPAGAQVHFRNYEMVRSGFYRGVPIYTRTTIEPNSMIFVPLSGGVVQPYERRRDGELAGTVGSSAPSFPVLRSHEAPYDPSAMLQAAAPPMAASTVVLDRAPAVQSFEAPPPAVTVERPVGTAGTRPAAPARPPERPRRGSVNGLYVQYDGARWFGGGPAVPLSGDMTRVGDLGGFPVYRRAGETATIYVPATRGSSALLAPYSTRR